MRSGRRALPRRGRRRGVAGLDDLVAVAAQERGDRPPRRLVVLDEQDRRPRPASAVVVERHAVPPVGSSGRDRDVELDGEPAELAPSRRDRAAHRLDEAADDRQADAGPAPRALALAGHAVELLEQARQRVVGHARAAVLDRRRGRGRSA